MADQNTGVERERIGRGSMKTSPASSPAKSGTAWGPLRIPTEPRRGHA